jgi:ABC-2 type transport system permease protein
VSDVIGWPSTAGLVARQIHAQLRSFWRTPIALFFTIMLPLVMLVLFNALFGDDMVETPQGLWPVNQFYTGGLAAFTAVSATYTNLANMVPIRREEGVLKRWRGTPLPTGIYVAGFVGSAFVLAAVGTTMMLAIGVFAYDLDIEAGKVPAMALTFLVGVCTFAALGLAVASLIPNARSAAAVANATILPLAFISNVFIPIEDPPQWLETLGNIFPLKPFVLSFQDTLNPLVPAPAFNWDKLALVALWGVGGALVAVRYFRWESTPGTTPTRRRRRSRVQASA